MLSKIYSMLKYCYDDSIVDKFVGIEFQLFILTVKSLLPYEDKIGCMFDCKRYKLEMDAFFYYKNSDDEILDLYYNKGKIPNFEDKLLEYKIIPIAICNTCFDMMLEEVLKIVMLFSVNKQTIIDSIIISSAIYDCLNYEEIDIETITKNAKERLIDFSLKEYLERNNRFEINKSYVIDFEKERINTIAHDDYFSDKRLMKYKSLNYVVNKNVSVKEVFEGNENLLNNFSSYLYKIRKGILNPEKLKYNNNIPDLKECLKHSSFTHPLLGKCVVVDRSGGKIIIKNKLGLLKVII